MMKPWEVIKELESTNSRLEKEKILVALRLQAPHDQEFWQGVKAALDPFVTYGVKQVPHHTYPDGPGLSYEVFKNTLGLLFTRIKTGSSAQELIHQTMNASTQDEWNYWYRRILIKDLKCGVTETTLNKIVKDAVPVFECQLAKDAVGNEGKLTGKKIIDYKLDGVRTLAFLDLHRKTVTLYSRNGKVLKNFPHIEQQLISVMPHWDMDKEMILDGEIVSSSFQELMTQVHRKTDVAATDAVYNVFDIIPLSQFETKKSKFTQILRRIYLENTLGNLLFNNINTPNLKILPYEEVDLDTEEGVEALENARAEAKRLGYEGVMVKDPEALYECKRSDNWLKIKPNITVDLTVVDLEAGTGRNEGRLGALVCEGEDQGRKIRVNVGSGLSDDDRRIIWNDGRDRIKGMVVEVRADAVTQNQDGGYSLRFPRFLRFRGFTPGEKI